jgi:small subunit ribosomal protein S9
MQIINALGRRKAAVARVYLMPGTGNITINGKDYKEYIPVDHLRIAVTQSLEAVQVETLYDVKVNVVGGGVKGQSEAIRLGIARALCEVNIEFRPALKAKKYLTRDAREVERKKYGKRKARRSTQFSKR